MCRPRSDKASSGLEAQNELTLPRLLGVHYSLAQYKTNVPGRSVKSYERPGDFVVKLWLFNNLTRVYAVCNFQRCARQS